MTSRAGWFALVTILVGFALSFVEGQEILTPTFRAGTTLIELTLVATDEKGQPVTDLRQNEIEIIERGKPRPIEFFRFDGAAFVPEPDGRTTARVHRACQSSAIAPKYSARAAQEHYGDRSRLL